MDTSVMQIRIDSNLKKEATELFENLGLDLPTAIRIFLKKSVMDKGIPFELKERAKSNSGLEALLQLNANAQANGTTHLTQKEIKKEINATKEQLYND